MSTAENHLKDVLNAFDLDAEIEKIERVTAAVADERDYSVFVEYLLRELVRLLRIAEYKRQKIRSRVFQIYSVAHKPSAKHSYT